jgi:hydrogenase expression/formation protein HypE
MTSLTRIIESVRDAAREAKIKIVAGDTKVVGKGEADQIFINTAGVGVVERKTLSIQRLKPGHKIVLSGQIGNHSIHLLSVREGLGFEKRVKSDCAPLNGLIDAVLNAVPEGAIASIRDVTRGGLCAVLHEGARASQCSLSFCRDLIPVLPESVMAADMLGINLIHLANEGCLCLFVESEWVDKVLAVLREHTYGRNAALIGEVGERTGAEVIMIEPDGGRNQLEELYGAELPRLC